MKARLIVVPLLIGAPVIGAPMALADPPATCADAQGPIYRDDPRYSEKLDREHDGSHDGVACENATPHPVAPVSSAPSAATLPTTGMDVGPGLVAGSAALAAGIALVARSRRAILKA